MGILSIHELKRHGRARRVSISMGGEPVRLHDVGVWIDSNLGLADVLDAEMATHLATVPLMSIFIEWEDLGPAQSRAHF